MESNKHQQPHKSKHITYINGPILFTAPHSGKLKRGGADYGEKRRVHQREKYTSVLAMRFAIEAANQLKHPVTGKTGIAGSFCIWSKDHKLNEVDLDPNYLQESNLFSSPFHQALHQFQIKNKDIPLFHIDVHGKLDRKDSYDLDLGVACMIKHWEQYGEIDFMNNFIFNLTNGFNKVLKGIPKHKEFTASCNHDPYLNGNWGEVDIATMTEQAIILGIPSIQLEIPLKMRAQLFKDEKLCKEFVGVLISAYHELIVNWWPAKTVPQIYDPEIGRLVETKNYKKTELDQLHSQYVEWEGAVKDNII